VSETPEEQIDFVTLAHAFAEKFAEIASITAPIIDAMAKVIPQFAYEIRGDLSEYLAKRMVLRLVDSFRGLDAVD
jgi:hypothetical protein